jgi:hypothetical protein
MEEHPLRNLLGKALLTTEGQAFRLQGLRHRQLATSAMDDGRRAQRHREAEGLGQLPRSGKRLPASDEGLVRIAEQIQHAG